MGFKSRIECSWISARGAIPRPEMNPARLCIRGYVVDYWPIFLLGKLFSRNGDGGRADWGCVKRLAFLERIFGADIRFGLTFSLAHKGTLLTSDPDGIVPHPWNVLPWDFLLLCQKFCWEFFFLPVFTTFHLYICINLKLKRMWWMFPSFTCSWNFPA